MATQLDKLDLSILKQLSDNARKPYLEISRKCGVSGAAVHQRIQRLTQNGVITGAETLIDPVVLGYDTCAYVGVMLREPENHKVMVERLREMPEVVECYITTGRYDMFTKIITRDNKHLLSLLQRIQDSGLARTETLIMFKQEFRRQPEVPSSIKE